MQAGNYVHYMARFISGFAVGFTSVWQLTLVTLAVVPLIALAGGSYAVVMIGLTGRSQKAYSKAGEICEEVCSKILGVLKFTPEKHLVTLPILELWKFVNTISQLAKRSFFFHLQVNIFWS